MCLKEFKYYFAVFGNVVLTDELKQHVKFLSQLSKVTRFLNLNSVYDVDINQLTEEMFEEMNKKYL